MGSIRTCAMLFVLALTLSLAATAAAQPISGPEFIPLATACRALDTRVTGTPLQANVPTDRPDWRGDHRRGRLWRPHHGGRRRAQFHDPPAARAGVVDRLAERGPAPGVGGEFCRRRGRWPTRWISGSGRGGTVMVQPVATAHLVIDVYGYFTDVEELPVCNTALGVNALLTTPRASTTPPWGPGPRQQHHGRRQHRHRVHALGDNTTGTADTATGSALLSNTTGPINTAAGEPRPPQQHHGRRQHRHGERRPLQQHHGQQEHRRWASAPSSTKPRVTATPPLGASLGSM